MNIFSYFLLLFDAPFTLSCSYTVLWFWVIFIRGLFVAIHVSQLSRAYMEEGRHDCAKFLPDIKSKVCLLIPSKKKKGLPFEFVRTKLFLIWSLPLGHVSLTFQHKLKVWKIISYFVVYDAVFTCFTLTIYFIVNLISGFTMNLIRVNTTFRISYFIQNLISWS